MRNILLLILILFTACKQQEGKKKLHQVVEGGNRYTGEYSQMLKIIAKALVP